MLTNLLAAKVGGLFDNSARFDFWMDSPFDVIIIRDQQGVADKLTCPRQYVLINATILQ